MYIRTYTDELTWFLCMCRLIKERLKEQKKASQVRIHVCVYIPHVSFVACVYGCCGCVPMHICLYAYVYVSHTYIYIICCADC